MMKREINQFNLGKIPEGTPERVILVTGATGVGKTTFINAVSNFLFNVDNDAKWRLNLIDENFKNCFNFFVSKYTLQK